MFKGNDQLLALKEKLAKTNTGSEITKDPQKINSNLFNSTSQSRLIGRVSAHKNGFGFVKTNTNKSYYIDNRNMVNLLPHQTIQFTTEPSNKPGEEKAIVWEVIKNPYLTIIASLTSIDPLTFEFTSQGFSREIRCSNQISEPLKVGDWVRLDLIDQSGKPSIKYNITARIGDKDTTLLPQKSTCIKYNIVPPKELDKDFTLYNQADIDLTHIPFITIDSPSTMDMDDALYLDSTNNLLYVAVADPSSYLVESSELDKLTKDRISSFYLPGMTVPMLSYKYSQSICALSPNQIKQALVAIVQLDEQNHPILNKLVHATVKSVAKMNYDEITDYLHSIDDGNKNLDLLQTITDLNPNTQNQVIKSIESLSKFYFSRSMWRKEHALTNYSAFGDFSFIFKDDKFIDIKPIRKDIANNIVEEVMLTVNQLIAEYGKTNNLPLLFSAQRGFRDDLKQIIQEYISYLYKQGILDHDKYDFTNIKEFKDLLNKLGTSKYRNRIMRFMVGSHFTLTAEQHFGLGLDCYTTWTSPIRKYSDLYNHRLLIAHIKNKPYTTIDDKYLELMQNNRGLGRTVEREVASSLHIDYLNFASNKDRIYDAQVTGITKFSVKVVLSDIGAVGNINIKDFSNSYIAINPNIVELSWKEGNETKAVGLGHTVQVKVKRIYPATKEVDFELVDF